MAQTIVTMIHIMSGVLLILLTALVIVMGLNLSVIFVDRFWSKGPQ